MAQYTGKRQVLIFGPPEGQQVITQLALLKKEAAGLKERDMSISVAAKKTTLYKKYGIAASEPFTIILVGKDGGEKYRSNKLTSAQQLFDLVDAMPMRKEEMRRGKRSAE